jgi:GntR family transcriptional repressor for pyruvate dehydrogenase complex
MALRSFKRIAKKTLSDEVFEQISDEIVRGRMAPGIQLPSERELCDALGVNRGAVREALQRLSQAGLVAISQGGGTKVLDFRRTAGLDVLDRLLFRGDGTVDLQVARGIMEMRAALAPDIARLCALRADAAHARALLEIVEAMEAAAGDAAELQTLSLRFWDVLVRGSGNIAYELSFNGLRGTYDRIRGALVHVMADEVRDLESYRSIAKAVERGDDVAAKHVAAALVEHGTHRVLELIAALESSSRPSGAEGAGDDDRAT